MNQKTKIIIIGGGFGRLYTAKLLANKYVSGSASAAMNERKATAENVLHGCYECESGGETDFR